MEKKSVFEVLSKINVKPYLKKKNGFDYLSWAVAWGLIKQNFPEASFAVIDAPNGQNYFTDGKTCWVKVSVTIEGLTMEEQLPVMTHANRAIPLTNVTSTEVNNAIKRCLVKACALHGLGLDVYAGEDLPLTRDEMWDICTARIAKARNVRDVLDAYTQFTTHYADDDDALKDLCAARKKELLCNEKEAEK